jgi:hypothetical protein
MRSHLKTKEIIMKIIKILSWIICGLATLAGALD